MSEKKQQELYDAIAEPVMGLRIKCQRLNLPPDVDGMLYQLVFDIHNKQKEVLNLPPHETTPDEKEELQGGGNAN